ncbi:MAG: hypothetical protein RL595_1557, partial [Planctomycetota bacterium]
MPAGEGEGAVALGGFVGPANRLGVGCVLFG